MNFKAINDKKKLFANKLLLLNFIRKGFGIDKHTLSIIQRSCPKSLKLIKECEKKTEVQKRNCKFILQEGILFAKFTEKFFNKNCIVLPSYIAALVLKHLHHERKMQLSSVFGQSFFTFNLSKLCQDVHDSRLHCASYFYKKNSNKLGLSWAKLSHSWSLKLDFEVEV